MKRTLPIALLALCATLGACGQARERSVNEMYNDTKAALVNKAADYTGRVETDLKAKEQGLEDQANEQLHRIEANAANTADAASGNEALANGQ
jgi:hypothetical protein